ncbi:heavy-metal-associated domain-containing protein [Flavobacterium sp. C4GT6]|uniref:heavy-metal-associated domain-containing protein n=1 Tax=Flavobacterium sp. C4GT6 TaxID=3103818 RepID=UPI002ED3DC27
MKNIVLVVLVTLFGLTAQAQDKEVKKSKNAKYEFAVNGNCDMCKKRIEKAAFSVKGVKSAEWHADHQDLHIILDENKASVEDVCKAVAKVGHDTEIVKATEEDFQKLHTCCMYDRME